MTDHAPARLDPALIAAMAGQYRARMRAEWAMWAEAEAEAAGEPLTEEDILGMYQDWLYRGRGFGA
jgi:hypothetical protein